MNEDPEIQGSKLKEVTRGALYLYVSSLIVSALGYVYWLIVSKLTLPEDVGIASTIVNIALIISSIAILGIPAGIKRFLGKAIAEQDMGKFRTYVMIGLIILILTSGIATGFILIFQGYISRLLDIPWYFVPVMVVLIITHSITQLFIAVYTSILRTKTIMFVRFISYAAKLLFGTFLVIIGLKAFGIVLGYVIPAVIAAIIYGIISMRSRLLMKTKIGLNETTHLLKAGMARWIPNLAQALGTGLGVVTVYGFQSAAQAGLYHIAYSVASVILMLHLSVMGEAYPVLSGMSSGREKLASRVIKISLAITAPLAMSLAVYGDLVLGLFGERYAGAHLP
ncbi:hypothetical protein DRN86_05790, partial [Candidatus Geothermarchaeota archaeon]